MIEGGIATAHATRWKAELHGSATATAQARHVQAFISLHCDCFIFQRCSRREARWWEPSCKTDDELAGQISFASALQMAACSSKRAQVRRILHGDHAAVACTGTPRKHSLPKAKPMTAKLSNNSSEPTFAS